MIYFMRAGETGHVKIGWTTGPRTLPTRRAALQVAHPVPLILIRTLESAPRWVETWFHNLFRSARTGGEWFEFRPEMMTIEPPSCPPPGAMSTRFLLPFPLIVTPAQCRAARGLLNWTQRDLSVRSEVSIPAIARFEVELHQMMKRNQAAIASVFTEVGIGAILKATSVMDVLKITVPA